MQDNNGYQDVHAFQYAKLRRLQPMLDDDVLSLRLSLIDWVKDSFLM
jgi:hypothetical protein